MIGFVSGLETLMRRLPFLRKQRQAILIVGMHRSGTSAITRVLNLLGADLPGNLFPSTAENTTGYWESQDVAGLNDKILASLDTNCYDDAPIDDHWFVSPAALTFQGQILQLLQANFSSSPVFVIKDPRISRLAPLWIAALRQFGARVSFCICARHPEEVYQSMLARTRATTLNMTPSERKEMEQKENTLLLWCRHMLDAEYHSRSLPRCIVIYDKLLQDWRKLIPSMISQLDLRFPVRLSHASGSIQEYVQPALKRQRCAQDAGDDLGKFVADLYCLFLRQAENKVTIDFSRFDLVRMDLNNLVRAYRPLRPASRNASQSTSVWTRQLSEDLVRRATLPQTNPQLRHVVFVSGNPDARGHIYRVRHPMPALEATGCRVSCIALPEVDTMFESLLPADLVVLFRAPWWAEKLYSLCRSHSVPICFDIDDLVFDRQYVTPQYIDHLRRHPEKTAGWQEHADVLLKSIREADFVTVATHALVAAVQEHGKPAYLVPNGFGEDMLAGADAVLKERQQTTRDGRVRIGYASGTKTHQKDFGQAVPAVVRMLADRTNCILTLVGELDLTEFPELTPFMERIEIRPLVPHDKLAWEFGRFDINLAPLDVASPFCQAKSEIKYTEAALVEVPTVASPTEPYRSAIQTNETGFCAETTDDWYRHLLYLVDHPEKRKRMGINGRRHVLARYGPDSKAQLVPRIYSKALSELAHSRRGT